VDGTRFLIAQVTFDGGDMHVGKVKWNDYGERVLSASGTWNLV